jgi:crotonobetainyl-CoA:carnitine CoA-transferase CaiB-like acyl-CoA transferase
MSDTFGNKIADALGADLTPDLTAEVTAPATLPSHFATSDLAVASVRAAALELGATMGAHAVSVNQRRALMWFDMTLRPEGWNTPGIWDPIAGDYKAADGWIRLHTNAPHHRDAALSVLGCAPERSDVAKVVQGWSKVDLESAIVTANGAAAAMHSLGEWQTHPQGIAVAREPLIAWHETAADAKPVALEGLRVLDLTRVLAGPVATRFLAGYGVNVLRIDPPQWDEPAAAPEVTLGKRCAALDLSRAEDRARFETLLKSADVLVHGYRPDALAALGYGSAGLNALAPHLIEVTLDAYGWTGPWAHRRGFDSLVQMSCGIADAGMRASGAGRPVPLPVQALDHATGYLMAAALLRALRIRNLSGRVIRARLSLARTAALLVSGGMQDPIADIEPETAADLAPGIENTGWGPARRIAAPITIDGTAPAWPHPSGPLHRHVAEW